MGFFLAAGKKTTYSPSFKEEAVKLFRKGGRSNRQLCEELGIKDKKTLREWVAKINSGESLEDGRSKSSHAIAHIKAIHSMRPFMVIAA